MKNITHYFLILLAAGLMFACQEDDYINDGGMSNPYVDMTTYDFLQSQPKFDSLMRIIDKAGLKDALNGNITFFATTNYGVADYVSAKKQKRIIELGDENISFSIDSLDAGELRDSMKIYMYEGSIARENLSTEGAYYENLLGPEDNIRYYIMLRRTRDYSEFLDYVDYINFSRVIGSRDEEETDQNAIPESEKDISYDCQTTGIITTTGIVHVLTGDHRLFFNAEPMAGN